MEMLETALAFAVAMILFSTVVAGLVEAALRTFARRPALIHRGVTQLIAEIARENPALVRKAGLGALDAWRPGLADDLTGNRLVAAAEPEAQAAPDARYPVGAAPKGLVRRVSYALRYPLFRLFGSHPAHAHRIETLTAYGFADRLKDHRLGRAITLRKSALDKAEDALGPADRADIEEQRRLWRDVVRRYERYRALTHESFRRSANRFTLIVALVFALGFNVDASRLIAHLSQDAEARRSLALSSEAITTEARAQYAAIAERLAALEEPSEAETGGETGGEAGAPSDAGLQALADEIRAVNTRLQPYASNGTLPVGFDFPPHCRWFDTCPEDAPAAAADKALWLWAVNALIAGLLIGLGGPFWYRVFGGLSNLATLLRGAGQAWTNPEELSTRPKVKEETDDSLDAEVTRVIDAIIAATNPPETLPASGRQAPQEGAQGQGASA